MNLSILILFSLTSVSLCQDLVSYSNVSLLRIAPENAEQLLRLTSFLMQAVDTLDGWKNPGEAKESVDVSVPHALYVDFLKLLKTGGLNSERLVSDLGKILHNDENTDYNCTAQPPYDFFCTYRSYDKIVEFMSNLASGNAHSISMERVGTSYEGRAIQALRIGKNPDTKNPVIWLQGGQHAWEQIGPAVALYIALELSNLLKNGSDDMLEDFNWYIIPVVNPDGYEYAQNEDRLWRKTRTFRPNEKNCSGVDTNRNWDIHWNDHSGSSSDPCSIFYAGPAAFSEPETRTISQYMLNNLTGPLKLFIDFHSYSQRWMSPYGYTHDLPRNYAEQHRVSKIAVEAVKAVHGYEYKIGSTGNILYTVAGGTRDWAYDVMNATFSYVVELRDTGEYGFLLPRNQILPNGEEIWAGIKAFGHELVKLGQKTN